MWPLAGTPHPSPFFIINQLAFIGISGCPGSLVSHFDLFVAVSCALALFLRGIVSNGVVRFVARLITVMSIFPPRTFPPLELCLSWLRRSINTLHVRFISSSKEFKAIVDV